MSDDRASAFVLALIVQALTERLDVFGRENAHLRVKVQQLGCPYGWAAPNGGCLLGYPGCACMDDLICLTSYPPATPHERYVERLEHRVNAYRERTRIAGASFRSMAEGFEKNREPSKAAACAGMADLMEDGL